MTSTSSLPAPGDETRRDHRLVGLAQLAVAGGLAAWALFWSVPTEVIGEGVLLPPGNAGVLNARAAGQIRSLAVQVGSPVTKGQGLMELRLPVLDRQLQQQRGNLAQLERIDRDLTERDRRRLQTETQEVTTALAKLSDDGRRYRELQQTYAGKLRNLEWLSRREVVAPQIGRAHV